MSNINKLATILDAKANEQRGVEVDGPTFGPEMITVPKQEYAELLEESARVRTAAYGMLVVIDAFVERYSDNVLSNGINRQTRILREAMNPTAVVTASPVPQCLAQQFPTSSVIDRQKRETIERCEAAASEENAGAMMSDVEPLD